MICCVTGNRPEKFSFERIENDFKYISYLSCLYDAMDDLMNNGCTYYISGMARGADMDFADAVVSHKFNDNEIILEAAFPYFIDFSKSDKSLKKWEILSDCDYINFISPYYSKGCMQKRNKYMVDKADIVLAIWNGRKEGGTWNTIKYARSKGKMIRYIILNENGAEYFWSIKD